MLVRPEKAPNEYFIAFYRASYSVSASLRRHRSCSLLVSAKRRARPKPSVYILFPDNLITKTLLIVSLRFQIFTLQGVVRSVCFHPNAQLLLTAGLDKSLRFFNVDGKKNPKVQGLFLEDMPVYKAGFTGDGKKVVAAGRRKWFYVVDLASARVERVRAKLQSLVFSFLSLSFPKLRDA
jgi:WD40 repeat protein